MQQVIVLVIIFLAVFTQSLSGFGSALVAMALLPAVIGLQIATPLVALVAITMEVVLLYRYRRAMQIKAIQPVVIASLVGIPMGIVYLRRIDERVTLTILGVVIIGYAVYSLLNIHPPRLEHPAWGIGAGLLGGILGGAYNTSGPPVIVYGDCKRWPQEEFKGNMQAFFVISSTIIALAHLIGGNITPEVWRLYLPSLPVIAAGIISGTSLDRYISQPVFRKIVIAVLIVMGLRLLWSL